MPPRLSAIMRAGHTLRGVSYYGTIVVGRPSDGLPNQPGIELFGFQHRWLRDLGEGWQLLETTGWADPPDLDVAVLALAESSEQPVFAAYVSDTCATLHAATPFR